MVKTRQNDLYLKNKYPDLWWNVYFPLCRMHTRTHTQGSSGLQRKTLLMNEAFIRQQLIMWRRVASLCVWECVWVLDICYPVVLPNYSERGGLGQTLTHIYTHNHTLLLRGQSSMRRSVSYSLCVISNSTFKCVKPAWFLSLSDISESYLLIKQAPKKNVINTHRLSSSRHWSE